MPLLPVQSMDSQPVTAAREILSRVFGELWARSVHLELAAQEKGPCDFFETQGVDGRLHVRGSSAVALARGAYDAIRRAGLGLVCWEGTRAAMPTRFPSLPRRQIRANTRWRHYLNVCTFGYTATWWDFPRWEREIDWMALHGINMPLAMEGQEAIWQSVWHSLGVPAEALHRHFCGPAFLPWQRMGGVDGHAGPLPQAWIENRATLQVRIMTRMKELGMTPVTPGFAGFVPEVLAESQPQACIIKTSGWCGFPPTSMVDFDDPLFVEIGRRFIETYRARYGTAGLYMVDSFNEIMPQFAESEKLSRLSGVGEAIFEGIRQGDPHGTWVMQGWLFVVRKFWGTEEVSALLSRVPPGDAVILDLAGDLMESWRKHRAFEPHRWIDCTLHNFGGSTSLCGDLALYARRNARTLSESDHGQLVGQGITPEGIEQNSVVTELLCDVMWQREAVDLEEWLPAWCRARYGDVDGDFLTAWQTLLRGVYARRIAFFSRAMMPLYTRRPVLNIVGSAMTEGRSELRAGDDLNPPPPESPREAAELFMRAAASAPMTPLLRRDLVDVVKRVLADAADAWILKAETTFAAGNAQALEEAAAALQEILAAIDAIVAHCPELRLSRWIDAARSASDDATERAVHVFNARLQVTAWSGVAATDPNLVDYARKEWSGLIGHYYAPRWRAFHTRLSQALTTEVGFDPDAWTHEVAEWERQWAEKETSSDADGDGTGDLLELCRSALERWKA